MGSAAKRRLAGVGTAAATASRQQLRDCELVASRAAQNNRDAHPGGCGGGGGVGKRGVRVGKCGHDEKRRRGKFISIFFQTKLG